MRKVKKISIVVAIVLILVGILGVIFASFYEDEIKKIILTEINKKVDIPIDVESVSFSIFKKFPYASLVFKNVKMKQKSDKKELAHIESIYLQFNIIDLIKKKYIIKKIAVENGVFTLLIDEKGKDNFHIFKPSDNNENTSNVLELKEVLFKNIDLYYSNDYKKIDGALSIEKLTFSGNFSADDFSMQTNTTLVLHQINSKNTLLLKNKTITLATELNVNKKTNVYKIKSGSLGVEDLLFNLSGKLTPTDNGLTINLLSEGNKLPFKDLFSLLPAQQKTFFDAYNAKGTISYKTTLIGEISATKTPVINASFEVVNANIEEKKSEYQLSKINFKGSYTNGNNTSLNTSKLSIKNLNASFGAGYITGNYTLTNFENPYIELDANANVDLEMAKNFFKLDTLEMASGNIILNLNYNGYVKNIQQIKAAELQKLNAQGNAQLENVQLKIHNNSFHLTNANGYFNFNNNSISIDSLTTIINNSPIYVKGKFTNLLAYLFAENEWLAIDAFFKSSTFNLNELIINSTSSQKKETYQINFPQHVSFNLTTQIDTFLFRNFKATHFKGNISLDDNLLAATDVSFKTMGGIVKGNIAIDNENASEILITSTAFLTDINIAELFYQFENFGQKEIVAANLKGNANIILSFASVMDKQLMFKKDKIYLSATVAVSNGQLINYQPIMALSKFIAVEDLQQIKFKQLNTQIEIINETITLSKTEVYNTALNLTVAGTHTFNSNIDYRFKVMLNDVLWKKAKLKKQNEEFGYVEDDSLGKTALFLKMTGTTENFKIAYDIDGLKTSWKENIKEEKKTIKTILNKEFGWFKKDSLSNEKEKQKAGFKMEWEEEQNKNKTTTPQEKNTKPTNEKEKKGLRKFLDKIAQPDADEFEKEKEF